jgi:hypothetical protein
LKADLVVLVVAAILGTGAATSAQGIYTNEQNGGGRVRALSNEEGGFVAMMGTDYHFCVQ